MVGWAGDKILHGQVIRGHQVLRRDLRSPAQHSSGTLRLWSDELQQANTQPAATLSQRDTATATPIVIEMDTSSEASYHTAASDGSDSEASSLSKSEQCGRWEAANAQVSLPGLWTCLTCHCGPCRPLSTPRQQLSPDLVDVLATRLIGRLRLSDRAACARCGLGLAQLAACYAARL